MTHPYQCRLSFLATVPEKPAIERFINFSVDCLVFCPICGTKHQKIKKNGHDWLKSGKMQKFRCKVCSADFYPHTSFIFKELMKIIIDRLIKSLYLENLSPKATAELYGVSQSTISRIAHHCKEIVNYRLLKVQQERAKLMNDQVLSNFEESMYWIDETFFSINKKSYALLLVIDYLGNPVAWKLSENRSLDQYKKLFAGLVQQLPEPFVLIGDGYPTYIDLCKWIRKECYLIQQVHSHPWEKAKLHHFIYSKDKQNIEQISMELPYNAFTKETRVQGHTFKRVYRIGRQKSGAKRRGRPKGTTKEVLAERRRTQKCGQQKKTKTRRGRKSLSKHGQRISFSPQPGRNGWNIKRLSALSPDRLLIEPEISELEQLLDVTYKAMKGGVIQSNKIESKNRVIKSAVPTVGLKGEKHLNTYINNHLQVRAITRKDVVPGQKVRYPFAKKLGLKNINQFIDFSTMRIKV